MAILKTLQHLPRDARDTLFMLMVMGWVVLPQVSQLPLWCSLLCAIVLLWRGTLAWHGQALPSPWWRLGLLAVATLATWLTFKTLFGREAGVTWLVLLLALKTLELRARRDALVVFFLCFFVMLSNFFHSQSLPTAAAMLVALLGLLTALVNAHMPVGNLLHAARTASVMAVLGTPVMVLLFVLFPRVAPLWGIPGDAMTGRSGLSASMTVGNMASLALDGSVAMRIKFDAAVPPQSELYFRGPVLSAFDGQTWRVLEWGLSRLTADLQVRGHPVSYQVTLEPNQRPWLLVLDATPTAPALVGKKARMTRELQWVLDQPVTDLLRYQVLSYLDFQHGPLTRLPSLQAYLALPGGYNPRTLQLAEELKRDPLHVQFSNTQWAELALERLRRGGYNYTLEPGLYGPHSADEFWFDRKAGFCEHIASAFVILMRALNVPARVVTGYQGGEQNSLDGLWTVRQSDAHAWAEIWQARQGWVRIDPTSAVAPARTGSLQRLAAGRIASAIFGNVSPELALNLRAAWDALNTRWNQWVLNYTQTRQLDLLKSLGFKSPGWEDLVYLLSAAIVLASLIGAVLIARERQRQDPWLRLLAMAAHRLSQSGMTIKPNSSPRQMAHQLSQIDSTTQRMQDWLIRLEALRYAPAHGPFKQQLATLQRELKHLC